MDKITDIVEKYTNHLGSKDKTNISNIITGPNTGSICTELKKYLATFPKKHHIKIEYEKDPFYGIKEIITKTNMYFRTQWAAHEKELQNINSAKLYQELWNNIEYLIIIESFNECQDEIKKNMNIRKPTKKEIVNHYVAQLKGMGVDDTILKEFQNSKN